MRIVVIHMRPLITSFWQFIFNRPWIPSACIGPFDCWSSDIQVSEQLLAMVMNDFLRKCIRNFHRDLR